MDIKAIADRIRENIGRVIVGREEAVELSLAALFCGGHVLFEDVPGTGKTLLARMLAASLRCRFGRVQFTPDLLPSDLTGIHFFNMKKSEFEFMPGPVFCNILLADEINRATPKTQAGLLECMEEGQVTIDGETHVLDQPFFVIATQNPAETQGVFPLPEAQLDRFLIKIPMEYPPHADGVEILRRFRADRPQDAVEPVAAKEDLLAARRAVAEVFVHPDLMDYVVRIAEKTRENDGVLLGVSPRGCLSLMRASQAFAALGGRNYVTPEDIKRAAGPVLAHRLVLKSSARLEAGGADALLREIVEKEPVPTEDFETCTVS